MKLTATCGKMGNCQLKSKPVLVESAEQVKSSLAAIRIFDSGLPVPSAIFKQQLVAVGVHQNVE